MPLKNLVCVVRAIFSDNDVDLGTFQMIETEAGDGEFLFDYDGISEELINRGIVEDEEVAMTVAPHIEDQVNKQKLKEGDFILSGTAVTISYRIA